MNQHFTSKPSVKKPTRLLVLIASIFIFLTACGSNQSAIEDSLQEIELSEEVTEEETTAEPEVSGAGETVTIRSIGDILLHNSVYQTGQTEDGYSFDFMFEEVWDYIGNADITTANMETIVAGSQLGVSSYPSFNAPEEIVDTLNNLGVDIVSNATNHTVDFGAEGAHASLDNLQEKGMEYVGSYDSWEDYNRLRIIEVNGIKVGFLSYTYGTNGIPVPEDEPYLVTLIDRQLIPLEIERLNEHCDISVVMIHYGEDAHYPVDEQIELTNLMLDAGVNFVLGGHSHIMQPMEQINDSQGVWYSHGNFLSGQYQPYEKAGGIGEFVFKKHEDGSVTLESMRVMPTYNIGWPEYNTYEVVPLADAAEQGLAYASDMYYEITERLDDYSKAVEVVDYLD